MARPLIKIAERRPSEVCTAFELNEESQPLLASEPTPEDFLRALIEQERYPDAAQYLAHALPGREAVWWGVVVVREHLDPGDQASRATLDAAESWVRDPSDENRRAAMLAAEEDLSTPAGMLGVATFMAAGSIAPAGLEAVEAPSNLTGTMVGGAVILTAVTPEPLEAGDKYKQFLARGIEIAQGPERA